MNGRVARWSRAISATWRTIDLTVGGSSAAWCAPLRILADFFVAYPNAGLSIKEPHDREDSRLAEGWVSRSPRPSPRCKGTLGAHKGASEYPHPLERR